jgi:hypothetical protein
LARHDIDGGSGLAVFLIGGHLHRPQDAAGIARRGANTWAASAHLSLAFPAQWHFLMVMPKGSFVISRSLAPRTAQSSP